MKLKLTSIFAIIFITSVFSMDARELDFQTHKIMWGIFSMIDAQDNCTDVVYDDKNAIHTITFENTSSDNLIRKWKNSDSRRELERNFKANFVANIKTKKEIEFLRNLGDKGYKYIIEFKSPKQQMQVTWEPWELKNFFQWNQ